jgi:hypothetical protein
VSLTSCTEHKEAKQILKAYPIQTPAKPIQPEPLQYTPLIPRTETELERQATEEDTALRTLKSLRFLP